MRVIAEGEIVHRSLRPRHCAKCAKQRVSHHLAGFDIARNNCGGIARIEHTPFGHNDSDRAQAALVHRDWIID